MPMKKHPVEQYRGYIIYVIVGISPTMFTAEKSDPTKGPTITDDSLDAVRAKIDETLGMAVKFRINTWDGPVVNQTFQNPKIRVKSCRGSHYGVGIIIESTYKLEVVISVAEGLRLRESKKHKRRRRTRDMVRLRRRFGQSR